MTNQQMARLLVAVVALMLLVACETVTVLQVTELTTTTSFRVAGSDGLVGECSNRVEGEFGGLAPPRSLGGGGTIPVS